MRWSAVGEVKGQRMGKRWLNYPSHEPGARSEANGLILYERKEKRDRTPPALRGGQRGVGGMMADSGGAAH